METADKHIALGVSGSIAAYKACELARLFVRGGYDVHVIMTAAAQQFVTPLTFQTLSRNPVVTGLFDPVAEWSPRHVSLAEKCRLLVIAPCTANVIAKLAQGIADDALSSAALAFAPADIVIAPAMNAAMYENPATQDNIALLKSRGVRVMESGTGDLACGVHAKGRMPEPAEIYETAIKGNFNNEKHERNERL